MPRGEEYRLICATDWVVRRKGVLVPCASNLATDVEAVFDRTALSL